MGLLETVRGAINDLYEHLMNAINDFRSTNSARKEEKKTLALSVNAQQTWKMIMFQSWIYSAIASKTDLEQTYYVD